MILRPPPVREQRLAFPFPATPRSVTDVNVITPSTTANAAAAAAASTSMGATATSGFSSRLPRRALRRTRYLLPPEGIPGRVRPAGRIASGYIEGAAASRGAEETTR